MTTGGAATAGGSGSDGAVSCGGASATTVTPLPPTPVACGRASAGVRRMIAAASVTARIAAAVATAVPARRIARDACGATIDAGDGAFSDGRSDAEGGIVIGGSGCAARASGTGVRDGSATRDGSDGVVGVGGVGGVSTRSIGSVSSCESATPSMRIDTYGGGVLRAASSRSIELRARLVADLVAQLHPRRPPRIARVAPHAHDHALAAQHLDAVGEREHELHAPPRRLHALRRHEHDLTVAEVARVSRDELLDAARFGGHAHDDERHRRRRVVACRHRHSPVSRFARANPAN